MATVATGAITSNTRSGAGYTAADWAKNKTKKNNDVWQAVVTFSLISGDTTGTATIPMNGILQKIIVTLTDMQSAEGTTDVALTDGGDNTIWSVSDLAESATYAYSVSEPFSSEINIGLVFDDPTAAATVTVTLRGI